MSEQHCTTTDATLRDTEVNAGPPDKRAWALFLAARGLPVFRLKTNSKDPLEEGWTEHATTDRETIERWWSAPDGTSTEHNIGIRTGEGWAAIDADCKPKHNKDGTPKLDEKGNQVFGWGLIALAGWDIDDMPDGYRQTTTTGGRHVILRLPDGVEVKNSTSKIAPDVDVRGWHGYVVGAGSTINGKPYVWNGGTRDVMPDKYVAWCGRTREKAADTQTPLVDLDKPRNVERAVEYLRDRAPEAIQGSAGNSTTFRVACEVKDYGISESLCLDLMGEHWNETGKACPPWDADDLAEKIANAYTHGSNRPVCWIPPRISNRCPNWTTRPIRTRHRACRQCSRRV